jgi:broad specificity phosphatase PhoE
MSWPNKLIIKRHGQSERNARRQEAKQKGPEFSWADGIRDQDSPLTELGRLQNLQVGRYLFNSEYLINKIYTSPFTRTLQGAKILQEQLDLTRPVIIHDERIRELDFGAIDGLTPSEVEKYYPLEAKRRAREGKYYFRPGGGENRPDLNLRVSSFLETIKKDSEYNDTILIECHSVVVLSFLHILGGWGEKEYLQADKQDIYNAGLTTYDSYNTGDCIQLVEFNKVVYHATITR